LLVRLLLGAVLLPLICAGFFVFSIFAACSDWQLLHRLWILTQRWILGEHRPVSAAVPIIE
jgi:hypothetical protein